MSDTEKMVKLSAMHYAMVFRLAGETPPEDIDGFRGMPGAEIGGRLAYLRKLDREQAVALAQRLGYGSGSSGPTYEVPDRWIRQMLSRSTGRIAAAAALDTPMDNVGYDGLTEEDRLARQLAEIYREGTRQPEPLSPPDLE